MLQVLVFSGRKSLKWRQYGSEPSVDFLPVIRMNPMQAVYETTLLCITRYRKTLGHHYHLSKVHCSPLLFGPQSFRAQEGTLSIDIVWDLIEDKYVLNH